MLDPAKLEEAVKHGLRKLTIYQSATGAWHAVALSTHGGSSGHSALRTASAAAEHALDEFITKRSPPAAKEDPFG